MKILKDTSPLAISGEQIATELGMSRAAVWKAINTLRHGGFQITSKPSQGYTLIQKSCRLSAEDISLSLSPPWRERISLNVLETVDSTNQEAKRLLADGAGDLTVILSSWQTHGKGRLGRTFHSPSGSGLYMSLIVRRELDMTDAILVTSAVAVAAQETFSTFSERKIGIKWVNDLYIEGKKVAGILTEGTSSFESGKMESLIIGIGVNLYPPQGGFPEEIRDTATTLFEEPTPQVNTLAASLIERIAAIVEHLHDRSVMQRYRNHSIVLGRIVTVSQGNTTYSAMVDSINDDGSLSVTDNQREKRVLNSGEISLRVAE
ncbi:MAG: biotin--[acetyl-CoA-carboxylase] ligase [Sphaerochaetaceae bacterium]|nr:biotin--[acetyl-CoA-carboxylase] ligase [Sphaerochaetaceae bacterium]